LLAARNYEQPPKEAAGMPRSLVPLNPPTIRPRNLSAVFRLIRQQSGISRAEIALQLRLNPSTVTRLVDEMLAGGIVKESAKPGSSTGQGGRRPIGLQLALQAGYLIGVDMGGSVMAGGVTDLNGEILVRRRKTLPPPRDGEASLALVSDFVRELLRQAPDPARVWGVGIGVPSWTLAAEGLVCSAPSLAWQNYPLRQKLEAALALPVFIENDVNLAALGEHWRGAGHGISDIVVIYVGNGIGAGIVVGGELCRGSSFAAGEIGYMLVGIDSLKKTYQQRGCLESLASCPAILERSGSRSQKRSAHQPPSDSEGALSRLFAAAEAGEKTARKVLAETERYLSLAVANIACLLNPEMIIVGGTIAPYAGRLLKGIHRQVARTVPVVPRLAASTLGKDAVIQGNCAMVLHQMCELNWSVPMTKGNGQEGR
jgi:predicted NBD/HSP70 family sugar kinase